MASESNVYLRPYKSPLNLGCNEVKVIQRLREFFLSKGFVEQYFDNRLSILAACEDPFNVSTYDYVGLRWPHAQTGQMWLEHSILTDSSVPGYFCLTKSNREEKNPEEGRHFVSFPLFEFEFQGDKEDLVSLVKEMLLFLGYPEDGMDRGTYASKASEYGVETLENEHEERMCKDKPVFFLTDFPEHTDPFWNMRRNQDGTSHKLDVILHGQETVGSAEREIDVDIMRDRLHKIVDGKFYQKMVDEFGKERVDQEAEDYLALPMIVRSGGGIGVTRLARSMKLQGIL